MADKIKVNSHIKESVPRRIFIVFNTVLLILLSFVFLAPYVNILAKSLNAASDTALGGVTFWPRDFTWDNFDVVINDASTWTGLKVTIARVVIGSLFSLLITYCAAYALLKKQLWGRGIIVAILTVPMFISGGVVANYIVYAKLNLYDTFAVYIFPTSFSFFNMVIIRTFLGTIPESLKESARLDGANEFQVLYKIVIPLSMPIIATILLWNVVGHWNDWTTTLYNINSPQLYTLQYNLQIALKETSKVQQMIADAIASGRPLGDIDYNITGESIQSAQIIFSTLPIVMVYPFLQKYFIKGVMIGGVKE